MSDDAGRYLVNLQGVTHELFGGDPEEIVLRMTAVGEGARTLGELAGVLREEADRYDRLHRDGWRLDGPFRDGVGRCRKADGQTPESPSTGEGPLHAVEDLSTSEPPTSLAQVVEGTPSLPAAATSLRAAAEAYTRASRRAGARLRDPVADGIVHLRP